MNKMQISTFVKASKFWTLKIDVPNRRVITIAGRIGTCGRKTIRDRTELLSNEDVRECAEDLLDRKLNVGYEQVA
jgi:predicted DNA-binding WGR domain protein